MANRMIKTQIDTTNGTITWTAPGTTLAAVVLDVAKVSAAKQKRAMYMGLASRAGDNAADEKTAAAKMAAVGLIVAHLMADGDEWELPRKTGPRPFDAGAVVAAMARVLFASDVDKANKAADSVAAKRTISREEALKLFAADERIAEDMARAARAASGKPKVDADALLGEVADEEPTDPTDEEMDPAAGLQDEDQSTLS